MISTFYIVVNINKY
jgi:hypothetical protein